MKIEIGYGLLTFRELENVFLYTSSSEGLFFAKIGIPVSEKKWISMMGAYDKTRLKASGNEQYYVETQSILVYIHQILAERQYFMVYCAGGVGIQQQNKNLITGHTKQRIPAYEVVPVGLAFKVFSGTALQIEAGYGAIVPLKASFVYTF